MSSESAFISLERRNTLKLNIEPPRLMHLRALVDFITENWIQLDRISFVGKFGNLLDLLNVDVQVGALTALVQFYDPPLICFTFKNFQMASTLEEYRKILCIPGRNKHPYCHVKHTPNMSTIANVLGIPKEDLTTAVKLEEGFKGFPRGFLEGKVKELHDKGKLKESKDVVALIIFGVVLFPHVDHFVDETAIDAFVAFKTQDMDPTTAILADLYYELHMRQEKGGGRIRCCVPVLYIWLKNHLVKRGHPFGPRSNAEWATYLLSLSEESIIWYSREHEIKEVIYRCGSFPNVPLIGTIGCINYNPALALIQLGAPMLGEPAGKELAAFIIY